jgi:hypothetical protein
MLFPIICTFVLNLYFAVDIAANTEMPINVGGVMKPVIIHRKWNLELKGDQFIP